MAKITTPVKGFTGSVVGVTFADGVGETDDEGKLSYFRRHGYKVGGGPSATPEVPDGDPTDKWTVKQLEAYAKGKDIDLGAAKSKADVLGVLTTKPAEGAADGDKSGDNPAAGDDKPAA